jgi:hypothetical protein
VSKDHFAQSEPQDIMSDHETTSDRLALPVYGVLSLVLGGCLAIAAITPSRPGFTLRLVAAGLVLFGFGQAVLWLMLGLNHCSRSSLYLALPAGIIAFAGIVQLSNNLGYQLTYWLLPLAAALAVPGCAGAWKTLRPHLRKTVPFGWCYVAVIAIVWVIYYLPISQLDSVPTKDGGIKWMYGDWIFHESVRQELANSLTWKELPPRTPGFCRLPLCYQYGSHGIGAQIMYWLGMTAPDAGRALSWLGLLSIMSAAICVGCCTAVREARKPLAGLLALVLPFLTPSLSMLFANDSDTSFRHPLIIIPPKLAVFVADIWNVGYGLAGGSVVWTCVIAFTVVALLTEEEAEHQSGRRARTVIALATLAIGLNCVGSLCCWAVGAGYGLLHGWRNWRTYLYLLVAAAAFILVFRGCGFDIGSGRYMTMVIGQIPSFTARVYAVVTNLVTLLAAGASFLLGFRVLAVLSVYWSRRNVRNVLLLFVLAYSGVFVAMTLLTYPIIYLGIVLTLFAAGPAAELLSQLGRETADATTLWRDACRIVLKYVTMLLSLTSLVLAPVFLSMLWRRSVFGYSDCWKMLIFGLLLLSGAYLLLRALQKSSWHPSRNHAIVFTVLAAAVSFLGVFEAVFIRVTDSVGGNIVLDAGRTRTLRFIHDTLPLTAIVATSHHDLPTRENRERSLMYSAVAGRHILLEGWLYMTAQGSPEFNRIRRDNAVLFSTADEREARRIVQDYGITHLIVEPTERLRWYTSRLSWLQPIANPGSMSLYECTLKPPRRGAGQ